MTAGQHYTYVALIVGCIECEEPTVVVGLFDSRQCAQDALDALRDRTLNGWETRARHGYLSGRFFAAPTASQRRRSGVANAKLTCVAVSDKYWQVHRLTLEPARHG